jgi:hypothetical protein
MLWNFQLIDKVIDTSGWVLTTIQDLNDTSLRGYFNIRYLGAYSVILHKLAIKMIMI